jgi:hypothetical protein
MQTINQDGQDTKIYLNFGRDLSSNTALTMSLEPERGDDIDVTPTIETSDMWLEDEYLTANYYVSYTITEDMFEDYTGRWRVKGTATIDSVIYPAEYKYFMVTA